MNLSDESVIFYLLDKKVLSEQQVVNGDTMVVPYHTRNNIFKILNGGKGKDLFLKQSEALHEAMYKLSKNEAFVYDMIYGSDEYATLCDHVPQMIHCDSERSILVFEYLSGTINLHEYYFMTKAMETDLAAQQGTILASYHITPPAGTDTSHFTKQVPWILKAVEWDPFGTFPNEPLKAQLLKYVIEYRNLKQLIGGLRDEWEISCLMHGDIKWANFVLNPADQERRMYLIDWETSDIGDAAWDVGGLMQSYFSVWIFSSTATVATAPDGTQLPDYKFDTDKMQASIVSFWKEYAAKRSFNDEEKKKFLVKSAKCAAGRLLQTSIEAVYGSVTSIEPYHYRCVQAAYNILSNPEYAVSQLFGANIFDK